MFNLHDWIAERFFYGELRALEKAAYALKQRTRILDLREEDISEKRACLAAEEAQKTPDSILNQAQPAPEAAESAQSPTLPQQAAVLPQPAPTLAEAGKNADPTIAPQTPDVAAPVQHTRMGLESEAVHLIAQCEKENMLITTNFLSESLGISQNMAASILRKNGYEQAGRRRVLLEGEATKQVYFWQKKAAHPAAPPAPSGTLVAQKGTPLAQEAATSGTESQPEEANEPENGSESDEGDA